MKMTKSSLKSSDFQKAVDLIGRSNSVLVLTHTKPDGDAAGCCVALCEALTSLGKEVRILLLSPIPQWYAFLFNKKVPVLGRDLSPENLSAGQFGHFDLIVISDTNSLSQLPMIDNFIKKRPAPILVIDHHETTDGLGDVEIVDSKAPAAASIVFELFKYANWPITPKVAEAIFVGIATDTGWFHYNNTDSAVLRTSAELIDLGVNPPQIYKNIYQNYSPQRFRLMTAMLDSFELHFDNRFAMQCLTQQDFKKTGAGYEDTENLIDECQRIGAVTVSALLVEMPDGRIRCSLRSRGAVDVCKIAQKFAGGGHPSAAGAYLPAPIDNAKSLIMAEVKKTLSGQ